MWGDLIPLALLGGVLGLDVVSFPQAMISRPLVAATLTGALLGQASSGLLMGATLELIALETLPFGAARYPEWGSAAVVGGALFASHPSHPAGALAVGTLSSLAVAFISGWSMVKLRERNAVWAAHRGAAINAGSRDAIIGLQLLGLTADLLRGALLTGIAYAALAPVTNAAIHVWTGNLGRCVAIHPASTGWCLDEQHSRAVVVAVAASVAGGAGWKLFHSTTGARWLFLGGLLAGLVVLFTR
jgi:PTS system mannose-specific IIC component